jgi:hypothetical protein
MSVEQKLAILNAMFFLFIVFFKMVRNANEIRDAFHKYDWKIIAIGLILPVCVSLLMLSIVIRLPYIGAAIVFISLISEMIHDIHNNK